MNSYMLAIDSEKEKSRIIKFIRQVFKKTGFKNAVIGLSGGVDSATCLYLLKEAIGAKNIYVLHLYYFKPDIKNINIILKNTGVPVENVHFLSIKKVSDILFSSEIDPPEADDKTRLGNIMARVRMIMLYDFAKKHKALVCGTENRTEHYLGYFTRFGDEASDFEPIRHLYKTQVRDLVSHLGVPKSVIYQAPTAGLWKGQTDEGQFGFSYEEADQVLYYYFDKKLYLEEIVKKGFKKAREIIERVERNEYKNRTPYVVE